MKGLLRSQFDMKDLGVLHYFLGIEVICIWLSQCKYVLYMLQKYGMANCKPILTLLDSNLKLRDNDGEDSKNATMYR